MEWAYDIIATELKKRANGVNIVFGEVVSLIANHFRSRSDQVFLTIYSQWISPIELGHER